MAIAEVTSQRNGAGSAGSTSAGITYPATPTQGNLLVACLSWRGDATITGTPTGWNLARAGGNGAGLDSAIYYKIAGASEATTHTWTLSASVKSARAASEWSGLKASPLDKVNSNTGTGTAGTTGLTGTLAQAAELVVALFSNVDVATWGTYDNSLTEIQTAVSSGGGTGTRNRTSMATKITSATTSINPGATLSSSLLWSTAVATFMEAPASQNVTPGLLGGASLFSPTVVPGSVSVSPGLLGGAQVFAPQVNLSVALSLLGGASLFTPTVVPGQVVVTPGLLGGAQVFDPTVAEGAAQQDITDVALLGGAQIFTPTVVPGSVTVTPGLLGGASVLAPTVAPGSVSVVPALLGGASVLAPTIQVGSVSVIPGLLGGASLFTPVVFQSGVQQSISPALLGGASIFTPTIAPGAVSVSPELLGGAALLAPSISGVVLGAAVVVIDLVHTASISIEARHHVEVSIA